MLPMPSQIEVYAEMTALSAQMVEAAQAHDWDRLVVLEKSVSMLRETLMRLDESNPGISPAEADARAAMIRRILDDDAEVRRHTEPWMEHVRQFLGGGARRRRVENAYNAGAGSLGGSAG